LSVIRLYLDEDAAQHDLIAALRLRGVEVTSAQEQGMIEATDLAQLEWCRSQSRVIYTFIDGRKIGKRFIRHIPAINFPAVAFRRHFCFLLFQFLFFLRHGFHG